MVCGLDAKLFGLSLVLGLMSSGFGLVEIGLLASKVYSVHDVN